jgi:hypothetical protein
MGLFSKEPPYTGDPIMDLRINMNGWLPKIHLMIIWGVAIPLWMLTVTITTYLGAW